MQCMCAMYAIYRHLSSCLHHLSMQTCKIPQVTHPPASKQASKLLLQAYYLGYSCMHERACASCEWPFDGSKSLMLSDPPAEGGGGRGCDESGLSGTRAELKTWF